MKYCTSCEACVDEVTLCGRCFSGAWKERRETAALVAEAFKRGVEATRVRLLDACLTLPRDASRTDIAYMIRDTPVPEDKP